LPDRATVDQITPFFAAKAQMNSYLSHLIDGYLVEFDRDSGWRCKCGDFDRSSICEHTIRCATVMSIERSRTPISFIPQ
jgi:hypothetical protein